MKVKCDVCENGEASVMCCADDAALCAECDHRIHTANKLASKHQRVSLLHSTSQETTCCDICQDKVGYFFCLEDRALLCRSCDYSIHSTNALTAKHKRFLVTGIRVALEASQIAHESAKGAKAFALSETHSSTMKASEVSSTKTATLPKVIGSGLTDSQGSGRMSPNRILHEQAEKWGITDAIPLDPIKLDQAPQVASSGQEAMVSSSSNLASVSVNPFDHQVHVNSNWELQPSIPGGQAYDRVVASQMGGNRFVKKRSISEYLTHTIPGWRVDDLLSFTDASTTQNYADHGLSRKDAWSYGDLEWQADSNTFKEFALAQGSAEVPSVPSQPPSCGVERSKRGWGLGNVMRPSDLDCIFQYDDVLVVPNGGALTPPVTHSTTSFPRKFQQRGVDF